MLLGRETPPGRDLPWLPSVPKGAPRLLVAQRGRVRVPQQPKTLVLTNQAETWRNSITSAGWLGGSQRKERAVKGSVYICSRCYLEEENTFISPVDCQLILLRQVLMENNKTRFSQAVSRTLTGQASTQNRWLWNIAH